MAYGFRNNVSNCLILIGTVVGMNTAGWAQIQLPEALATSGVFTPLTADVTVTTSANTPSGKFTQTQSGKYYRSSNGKTRQDTSFSSVITDRAARTITSVDHRSRRATILHFPDSPQVTTAPPDGTRVIAPPTGIITDLGESVIDGHRVVGKKNEAPGAVAARQRGTAAVEVWTSEELRLPIWTKQVSSGGETFQKYENIKVGEPDAALFLIPAGYTVTEKTAPVPGQVAR